MKKLILLAVMLSGCATTPPPLCDEDGPNYIVVSAPPRGFGGRMKRPIIWVQDCVEENLTK